MEQIELLEVNGVVDVEAELLEVGDDDIDGFLVAVLIAKGLSLDLSEVGRFMVFQLNHTHHLAGHEHGAISLLAVALVFLLSDEVVVWRRIERIAQYLDKQLSQKAFLKLFFLTLVDVLLDVRIEEII